MNYRDSNLFKNGTYNRVYFHSTVYLWNTPLIVAFLNRLSQSSVLCHTLLNVTQWCTGKRSIQNRRIQVSIVRAHTHMPSDPSLDPCRTAVEYKGPVSAVCHLGPQPEPPARDCCHFRESFASSVSKIWDSVWHPGQDVCLPKSGVSPLSPLSVFSLKTKN